MSEAGIHVAVARARAGMVGGAVPPTVAADVTAVTAALAEVMDPELPMVSIVELGMVGDVAVGAAAIRVELLPTFVGCPATRADPDRRGRPGCPRCRHRAGGRGRRELLGAVDAASGSRPPVWSALATAGIAPPTEPADVRCPYCG